MGYFFIIFFGQKQCGDLSLDEMSFSINLTRRQILADISKAKRRRNTWRRRTARTVSVTSYGRALGLASWSRSGFTERSVHPLHGPPCRYTAVIDSALLIAEPVIVLHLLSVLTYRLMLREQQVPVSDPMHFNCENVSQCR